MMLPGYTLTSIGGDRVLFLRNANPINYDLLCRQTVTVYRKEGDKYARKVYSKAFLDFKKTQSVDKTGSTEANSFLLVVPGASQAVFIDDKVLLGEGPEISTREEWAKFIPANVEGLVVVKYVDPKYWGGQMVHTEAGG